MQMRLAAFFGFVSILALAGGAHMLTLTTQEEGWLETGAWMLLIHAILLVYLAGRRRAAWIPALLSSGVALFSFSLLYLAVVGTGALGPFHWITPIGGLLLLIGWGAMIVLPPK